MDWTAASKLIQEAFRESVNDWIARARFMGGQIQVTNALLTPGSLTSEVNLRDATVQRLIRSKVPPPIALSVAGVLAGAWDEWAAGFQMSIPGAYPTFAAVPAPFAQATSVNMMPLRQGSSAGETSLRAPLLARKLIAAVRPQARTIAAGSPDEALTALATWVDASFEEWKRVVTIGPLTGKGPVPTFAPPYVPVGPVVMGDNMSVGPAFIGPRFGKLTI